jgi:hypothetical protein
MQFYLKKNDTRRNIFPGTQILFATTQPAKLICTRTLYLLYSLVLSAIELGAMVSKIIGECS